MKTPRSTVAIRALAALSLAALAAAPAVAADFALDTFERRQLTDVYYSEGAGAGDIDGDGHVDIVYGPYWFAGPEHRDKREIYPPKPQPTERYADNFFSWVRDFDRDGDNDVFVVGFPATPAHVYENPGRAGLGGHWKKHRVFEAVANESPHFIDIAGDPSPELVCTFEGRFGFATIDPAVPFAAWTFHAVSEKVAPTQFGHGLGVGDVDGDGRKDIIFSGGWIEQPDASPESAPWKLHEAAFTDSYGGAEMHAYDVDGDGDNDIITAQAAHDFGLAWYEQRRDGDRIEFRPHVIMGHRREHNRYGVLFTEPHSVQLADIDGDGLQDIVTGKTYWSHHRQSPMWDSGAVVYWFRLTRGKDGVDWVPWLADGEAGIGRQIGIHDVDGDGLLDIVTGGMKGAHVLLHRREKVGEARFKEALPRVFEGAPETVERGPASPIDATSGRVAGALEGESLEVLRASAGAAARQAMGGFKKDRWSGGEQLFWNGAGIGDRLELSLPVEKAGRHTIAAAFTMARDYGIVTLSLDDKPLGAALDLFSYPDVITTGVLALGDVELAAGKHRLTITIAGANVAAAKTYRVGLDYVRLTPAR